MSCQLGECAKLLMNGLAIRCYESVLMKEMTVEGGRATGRD